MVEKGYNEPQDEATLSQTQRDTLKDARKRDNKVLYLIYQGLDDDKFEKFAWSGQIKFKGVLEVKFVFGLDVNWSYWTLIQFGLQ